MEKKLIKEFEVKLSIKCFMPIYAQTALQDLQQFLDIWEEVHKTDSSIKIKSHKVIKVKKKMKLFHITNCLLVGFLSALIINNIAQQELSWSTFFYLLFDIGIVVIVVYETVHERA